MSMPDRKRVAYLHFLKRVLPGLAFSIYAASVFSQRADSHGNRGKAAGKTDDGLAHHDFFDACESQQERMFIVRGGRVVWPLTFPG